MTDTDHLLDVIIDITTLLLQHGEYEILDQLIGQQIPLVGRDLTVDLGWLSASFPGKSLLPIRQKFYSAVDGFLAGNANLDREELLRGLE